MTAEALPGVLGPRPFDLVHAQDSLSGNALATLRESARLSIPWLRTVHHLDVFDQPELNHWQERAWRAADGVACVSDIWLEHLRSVHGCRAERVLNGVNLTRYRPRADAGDDGRDGAQADDGDAALLAPLGLRERSAPMCLLVGGVESRKNTVRLLRAFARLRVADAAWEQGQLVVAGGASMLDHRAARGEWQQTLVELGLAEGPGLPVLRTGALPDGLLAPLMRRARVLAMPSLVEGFGLAALEALACGTPVLVSERPPFTEHLGDCESAAWCDPLDIDSIVSGLQRAARLPRPSEPPRVCREHSWQRSAQLHEAWYRRTLQAVAPLETLAVD